MRVVLAERVRAVVVQSGRPVRVHREVRVALVVHAEAVAFDRRAIRPRALPNARRAHSQRLAGDRLLACSQRVRGGGGRRSLDGFDGFQDRNALCIKYLYSK